MNNLRLTGWWLLGLVLWLAPLAAAQTLTIDDLLVEIWPEYDRPEALVIYRAELSPNTPLPAEVTFPLPGYVTSMHVVAAEQNGSLREIRPPDYTLRTGADQTFLTFQTPSPVFQFEYYDPVILARRDPERTLAFQFAAPYPVRMATFEVQEPFGAGDFAMTPAPTESTVQGDGLRYNFFRATDLAPGEVVELSASYQRSSTTPSVEDLAGGAAPNVQVEAQSAPSAPRLAYILIGLGAILLLASMGMWWRLRQATPAKAHRPHPVTTPAAGRAGAKFCYRCGTPLRPEAKFCHSCGAERRR